MSTGLSVPDPAIPFHGAQRLPLKQAVVLQRRGFATPGECAGLIALIEAQRRPSAVDYGPDDYRTSETCDMDPAQPLVAALRARMAAFVGVDPAHAEPTQGQRYAPGQQYKKHYDWFEPGSEVYGKYCTQAGNRTWTAMLYLNQPADGGATRFNTLNKTFQPEAGKLLAWRNLNDDGSVNRDVIHEGMRVRAGVKHIITQWFRERPWAP